jgi:hypothetical protein
MMDDPLRNQDLPVGPLPKDKLNDRLRMYIYQPVA